MIGSVFSGERHGWIGDLEQDLRYGARALRRAPTFTVVAVLTLALGIGASTAVFSVVNAVLLRPLPYPESDRLVRVIEHLPIGAESLGYPQRLATIRTTDMPTFRSQVTTLSHVGTYEAASMILVGRGDPLRVDVTRLSPAVVAMLGVPASLGRTFDEAEERAGSDAVVVLGHAIWQRYFGSSPHILGESLTLDGRTYSVIGVMPEGFRFPDPETQLWIPYTLSGVSARVAPIARIADGASHWLPHRRRSPASCVSFRRPVRRQQQKCRRSRSCAFMGSS